MDPRHKKLIIALGVTPFLLIYAGICLTVWDALPESRILDFFFFIAAGTLWAFPLKPVMLWVNKPKEEA